MKIKTIVLLFCFCLIGCSGNRQYSTTDDASGRLLLSSNEISLGASGHSRIFIVKDTKSTREFLIVIHISKGYSSIEPIPYTIRD